MNFCELTDRALFKISGDDAAHFMHGIFTCDVENLKVGELSFGALLTPQGKILFDFFIIGSTKGFVIDVDASMADDFVRRLMFYRLRSKVKIEPMDARTHAFAIWDDGGTIPDPVVDGLTALDPRNLQMGLRAYIRRAPKDAIAVSLDAYAAHRIAIGIPQGGIDYSFGEAFPHEALMDQFGGVDFAKGCYVGQEVVSRMQHRGTARKRIVQVTSQQDLPAIGSDILADGKSCGSLTSVSGSIGLAMVRTDKAAKAVTSGSALLAGTTAIKLKIPDWARFSWPESE